MQKITEEDRTMPTIQWNKAVWDGVYAWADGGEEWSDDWGGAYSQWKWCLYPRIQQYMPVKTVLEIGPGFGRWTEYLLRECDDLFLVDLSESCIEACRDKFNNSKNINYFVNDGYSLDMIEDDSIDLAFSFDSLVHAERDVIEGYLEQISTKLKDNGVGVIHHSNLGEFRYFHFLRKCEELLNSGKFGEQLFSIEEQNCRKNCRRSFYSPVVELLQEIAMRLRLVDRSHMRALSMTANVFSEAVEKSGMQCLSQEIIPWGKSRRAIDCISIFTKNPSERRPANKTIRNNLFMRQAEYIKSMSAVYRR